MAVRKTHCNAKAVSLSNPAYRKTVSLFFKQSLSADTGRSGDITTDAVLKGFTGTIKAGIIAKSEGVIAGMEELSYYFRKGPSFRAMVQDGHKFRIGQNLAVLKGTAGEILVAERTVLNFLQRMSGIATLTGKFIDSMPAGCLLTATRKTLWPILDKKAVVAAGGGTHRMDLSDAILVKDNHLALLNNDFNLVFRNLTKTPQYGRFMEIEAGSVKAALYCIDIYEEYRSSKKLMNPLYLMLDNFKPAEIRKVIGAMKGRAIRKNIFLEASGGICLDNVRSYARTGVDIISSGALTHSAPAMDISLDIVSLRQSS